ncbi:MAG TPA: 4Fe-4S dicluster domain-containing protein [Ktedonobacteraceae bacterium]|nr:4Fe-4S dicluster domain-containing protein [Ktedonobacteraceae bacterium]
MAVEPSNQTNPNKGAAFMAALSNPVSTITNTLAPLRKEPPLPEQPALGFFTDTSLCIGCKACEVACKQWNQLPAIEPDWTGTSYDNTGQLSAITWRHVQFIEQIGHAQPALPPPLPLFQSNVAEAMTNGTIPATPPGTALPFFSTDRWLMQSDVCKHCANAPCQEACPTGAIIRTEFDTVYVQQDICNGCGYCIVACPFGVIARDEQGDHRAHKCTLCYDRLKDGLEPACAKACPTDSIQFGEVDKLKAAARERLGLLHKRGVGEAQLYGVDDTILDGGLNSFFLLLDEPAVYNLPENPQRPSNNVAPASLWTILAAMILGIMGIIFFRSE